MYQAHVGNHTPIFIDSCFSYHILTGLNIYVNFYFKQEYLSSHGIYPLHSSSFSLSLSKVSMKNEVLKNTTTVPNTWENALSPASLYVTVWMLSHWYAWLKQRNLNWRLD